jgi:hypothetical protein
MSDQAEFIEESDLNYDLILKRTGATLGDEDFDVFKCPVCRRIYLLEGEEGIIFIDPENLSLVSTHSLSACLSCNYSFPQGEPIAGPKSNDKYRVTRTQLLQSKWNWLLPPSSTKDFEKLTKSEKMAHWGKIEGLIQQALTETPLPTVAVKEIKESFEHNELGLAFETMVDALHENNIQLGKIAHTALVDAGKAMGFSPENNNYYKLLLEKLQP